MPADRAPLLSVTNLSAWIGGQAILRDVSLRIAPGECVAVVGGSGAGKSTLMRCIMGLDRPARPVAGRLEFLGQVRDYPRDAGAGRLDGIGFVPQNPACGFDPLKSLRWQWRQLARVATGRPAMCRRQRDLLASLGLGDFAGRYPHEWSRGMQQRLLLAMALVKAPRLLVLDEPTSALDPLIAARVLDEVRAHAAAHDIATLIVTHDLALAAKQAQRIAIMHQGRVVEFGPTARLLSQPDSAYARDLVAHRSWIAPAPDHTLAAE
ncbi:ATP-binding cassette domain-containing protein [Actibacterium ureilyticum]|uniref:ATP-binding cassette domain-containing protein n=1 Tax=Actibacterium ureilyticum TaxID=1590614 RepID=UPI001FE681BE|nr:dipeptide/oligopeptide/nickel ABC transporter ATP-binding protein [Actibacterium ureilyticum]